MSGCSWSSLPGADCTLAIGFQLSAPLYVPRTPDHQLNRKLYLGIAIIQTTLVKHPQVNCETRNYQSLYRQKTSASNVPP